MIDIDLDAIRKRDKDWRDDGRRKQQSHASRDRRALIAYIDSLDGIIDDVSADLKLIKAKLLPAPPPEPDALEAFEAERPSGQKRKHRKRDVQT